MLVDPAVVEAEERYCKDCPLRNSQYVAGTGDPEAPIMVIGTAPGEVEEKVGLAFTGENGMLVRSLLSDLGVDAYFTNVLKRRPISEDGTNRKPRKDECWKCGSHLTHEIVRNRPRAVLVLGVIPLEFLLGIKASGPTALSTIHGLPLSARRYAMQFSVIPTFDPSYVMRRGGLTSTIGDTWLADLEDFAQATRRY